VGEWGVRLTGCGKGWWVVVASSECVYLTCVVSCAMQRSFLKLVACQVWGGPDVLVVVVCR